MSEAKSPTEQIRDLALEVRALTERDATRKEEVVELKAVVQMERESRAVTERENANLRQELAVLRQQLKKHISQYQEWDRLRWGRYILLVGANLLLASG